MTVYNMNESKNVSSIEQPGFITAIKVTAGITSILSILGASLIIFTYIAFRNLRTTARQLLTILSVADIIVATSHFVGLCTNFERFIYAYNNETWNTSTTDAFCISQAAFSMFGTIASFLLTIAIGVYMIGLVLCKRPSAWQKVVPVMYIICWGVPAVMIVPNAVKHYFGFGGIGWCYIIKMDSSLPDYVSYRIVAVFSYELWAFLVMIVLPIIYTTVFIYVRCKIKKSNSYKLLSPNPSQGGDLKLLMVPILFILLRIWLTILLFATYNVHGTDPYKDVIALFVLIGIGDNAQGFVNAILFCAFTKQVRKQLFSKESYKNMCKCQPLPKSEVEELEESTSLPINKNGPYTRDRDNYGTHKIIHVQNV